MTRALVLTLMTALDEFQPIRINGSSGHKPDTRNGLLEKYSRVVPSYYDFFSNARFKVSTIIF